MGWALGQSLWHGLAFLTLVWFVGLLFIFMFSEGGIVTNGEDGIYYISNFCLLKR